MKKRIISMLLVLAMVLSMAPVAFAAEVVASGTCGENLTWTLTDDGVLTISGTGEMANYDYEWRWTPWYNDNDRIEKAVVEEGVTSIGDWAFSGCNRMISFSIPDSVATVGSSALSYCDSLTQIDVASGNMNYKSVDGVLFDQSGETLVQCPGGKSGEYTIPDGVAVIGDYAFAECRGLTDVVIPVSVTGIGDKAFDQCAGLTSVAIPENVTSIGDSAFYACQNLTSITLPEGITSIGDSMFYLCKNLTGISIPDGVTSIGRYAFSRCEKLTSLVVPENVTSIADGAFMNSGLTDICFVGAAPDIAFDAFGRIQEGYDNRLTADVYYPAGDDTWADAIAREYGGVITWISYEPECVHSQTSTQNAVEASCTANGYTGDRVCLSCGETVEMGTQTEKKAHTVVTDGAVPATCTTLGKTEGEHCSVCGTVIVEQQSVAATGHSFGAWTQVKAPTIAEEGLEERACGCGEKESRAVAKLTPAPTEPTPTEPTPTEPVIVFTDVSEDQWFYDTVQWAVAEGITNGTTATTFEPDATCTRNQVVTFLWRAAGEPEPASAVNPFADVKEGDYFYKAVLWAVEKGITTGVDATHFDPEGACTRAQVVTFLHRAANKPAVAAESNPFNDVKKNSNTEWYYNAVLWAVGEEITTGVTNTTFEPESTCTRAQIVTFLYRYMN